MDLIQYNYPVSRDENKIFKLIERKRKREEKEEQKELKIENKQQISYKSKARLISVAEEMHAIEFTIGDFTKKYIEMYGRMNPFSGVEMDDQYDLDAGIRSIVYECSPSSMQHWFKYGIGHNEKEVGPWIFVNKNLADFNNAGNWKMVKARDVIEREAKYETGKWEYLSRGGNERYVWNVERYGPLPTRKQLKEATVDRKIGVRGAAVKRILIIED